MKSTVLLIAVCCLTLMVKPVHAAYVSSGTITLCHDAGRNVNWSTLAVDADSSATNTASNFAGTTVGYQIRTELPSGGASSCTASSGWTGWNTLSPTALTTKSEFTIPAGVASSRFIQIRFTLSTTSSANSPSLNSATITDTPAGDITPPTASITTPTAGAVITGTAAKLTATASDAGSGMGTVQFQVDGQNIGTPVSSTNSTFTTNWNSTTVPSGTHTIGVIATDKAGNSSAPVTVSALVVNVTVAVTAPAAGSTVSGTVILGATSTNGGGNTNRIFWNVDGSFVAADNTPPGPWSASWDSTKIANGTHTMQAVARVDTTVVGKSPVITFTVKN